MLHECHNKNSYCTLMTERRRKLRKPTNEECSSLQPMFPPKRFDNFPPFDRSIGCMPRRFGCVQIFLKIKDRGQNARMLHECHNKNSYCYSYCTRMTEWRRNLRKPTNEECSSLQPMFPSNKRFDKSPPPD